jgi:RND family efflux transporter MFP subunit
MPTERDPTEVTQARAISAPVVTELVGVVTSRKSAVISAQVQARIEKLTIRSGQRIKAGDRLATLDKTELLTRLAQAEANEKSAQMEAGSYGAQAGALRSKMIAATRLHSLGVSSPMEVTSARAEYAQIGSQAGAALAKANTARAEREQCEINLAKAEIVAPLDGIVTNIKAHEGEIAQIGTPLARVFDPSDLIIRFAVPREQRAQVALGQRVELAIDGDQRIVAATVTNISAAQEPPINFTVVEADIDDSKLTPDQLTVASVGRVRIADARGARQ